MMGSRPGPAAGTLVRSDTPKPERTAEKRQQREEKQSQIRDSTSRIGVFALGGIAINFDSARPA
jgi:hypothetical protein